jgi:hypothetical protein
LIREAQAEVREVWDDLIRETEVVSRETWEGAIRDTETEVRQNMFAIVFLVGLSQPDEAALRRVGKGKRRRNPVPLKPWFPVL